MDAELKRYLNAVVVLLSLNIGFLATLLWASAESLSATFLIIPPAVGAAIAGGAVWLLTGTVGQ